VYLPVVKAYLAARWRGAEHEADDAAQDVFVECFRAGGLLQKADPERDGGFRAFLLGAVRNVARRHETHRRIDAQLPADLPADDTGPAEAFDRAWARSLLKEAGFRKSGRKRSALRPSGGCNCCGYGFTMAYRSARSRSAGARMRLDFTTSMQGDERRSARP
jgi:DNA-directed RNA polymerase specialized sigma24 family protein